MLEKCCVGETFILGRGRRRKIVCTTSWLYCHKRHRGLNFSDERFKCPFNVAGKNAVLERLSFLDGEGVEKYARRRGCIVIGGIEALSSMSRYTEQSGILLNEQLHCREYHIFYIQQPGLDDGLDRCSDCDVLTSDCE